MTKKERLTLKPVVCVTEKEYLKAEEKFKNSSEFDCMPVPPEEDILSKAIIDNQAYSVIPGVENYSDKLYTALPKGGIIARFGVGHDGVDKQKATDAGLIVTNTPGVLDDSVAEHAILLMGSLARNISIHDRDMKDKQWKPAIGKELKDKILLIIGCGAIGRKTAKIASFGFGMNVTGYDVAQLDQDRLKKDYGFNKFAPDINKALAKADFISIHLPSIPKTKHFVDSQFLSETKHHCCIINTARGLVVDEISLYDALKSNKTKAAALDVFETEPYKPIDPDKDLRTLDNVILTPHIGSSTNQACWRMAVSCLKNIKAAWDKKYDQLDILNKDVLAKL